MGDGVGDGVDYNMGIHQYHEYYDNLGKYMSIDIWEHYNLDTLRRLQVEQNKMNQMCSSFGSPKHLIIRCSY